MCTFPWFQLIFDEIPSFLIQFIPVSIQFGIFGRKNKVLKSVIWFKIGCDFRSTTSLHQRPYNNTSEGRENEQLK